MQIPQLLKSYNGLPISNKTTAMIADYLKDINKAIIYGWHVDPNVSDSYNAVTYLNDAIGKIPASMGNSTFSYGGWENSFFIPKPCMLKFDGTVDYYLDPNDYTKKVDGTYSDIANTSYAGNAMMEWSKIWYKFEGPENKDYRPVEYIKCTGTQYILTDIIPNYQMRIDAEIMLGNSVVSTSKGGIFGFINNDRRFAMLLTTDRVSSNTVNIYGYCGYPWRSPDSTFSFGGKQVSTLN